MEKSLSGMTMVKKVEKEYFAGKRLKVFGPIGNQMEEGG